MVAAGTLKKYISRCDNLLESDDWSGAEALEGEIIAVFKSDFAGLTQGLDLYSFGALNGMKKADYIKDIGTLRARLQKEYEAIQPQVAEEETERSRKIFISHATKDKDYVGEFIKLLESLGFRDDEIICSSIPPYCIPLDNKVYEWLVNEFQHSDLHVVYALSNTYYSSHACLNEMGAVWAMKHKWTAILLPGFDFREIDGCIDSTQVSIKLDDHDRDTLRFRLGELKDNLIAEFGLRKINDYLWEKKRNEFLEAVATVTEKRAEEDRKGEETEEKEMAYVPIVGIDDVGNIPIDSAFLLVYAAEGNGQIMKSQTLGSSIQVSADGKQFMVDDSKRESARWVEALDRLIEWRWVKPVGHKGQIFELTGTGYAKAKWLKDGMGIDTSKEPLDELQQFVG